jgi:thymidylate synthase
MNKLDKQYTALLQDILDNGVTKQDRTGTGTLSVFGRQIRHKMSDGFPLLTTKKMPFKTITTELLWFLRGDTNIKYLVDNNCHIWDGDAYKNYLKGWEHAKNIQKQHSSEDEYYEYLKDIKILTQEEFINKIKTDDEFAKVWGDLGPVYGKQWRSWETYFDKSKGWMPHNYDQIANLINDLKTNPDSRRLMVNAWNVGELDQMVLPPCHYGFQVYTRELSESERFNWYGNKIGSHMHHDHIEQEMNENNVPTRAISLMWNQRSVDTFLGLPFNIASYGLLLEIISKEVNMVPDELIGNLGDTHLYSNHIEQAKEQIGRELSREERYDLMPSITGHSEENISNRKKINNFEGNIPETSYHEEWLDSFNIPTRTREPYTLPTLKHMKSNEFYKSLSEDVSLFTHLDINDFSVEGYQSHPHIKAPLSN